jgi:hypothetical protein
MAKRAFALFDEDGSGAIAAEELTAVLRSVRVRAGIEKVSASVFGGGGAAQQQQIVALTPEKVRAVLCVLAARILPSPLPPHSSVRLFVHSEW